MHAAMQPGFRPPPHEHQSHFLALLCSWLGPTENPTNLLAEERSLGYKNYRILLLCGSKIRCMLHHNTIKPCRTKSPTRSVHKYLIIKCIFYHNYLTRSSTHTSCSTKLVYSRGLAGIRVESNTSEQEEELTKPCTYVHISERLPA